jgi:hypothetical protein
MNEAWLGRLELINILVSIMNIVLVAMLPVIVKTIRKNLRSGLATSDAVTAVTGRVAEVERASAGRINEVEHEFVSRVTKVEQRVSLVEKDLEYRPTQEIVDEIRAAISVLKSASEVHTKQLETVEAAVRRIEDYLLRDSRP